MERERVLISAYLLLFLATIPCLCVGDVILYSEGTLPSGWEDWSWSTTNTIPSTAQAHSGANSIKAAFSSAYAGFSSRANLVTTEPYTHFEFWIKGSSASHSLRFYLSFDDGNTVLGNEVQFNVGSSWKKMSLSFAVDLGSPGAFTRYIIQDQSGVSSQTLFLDDMVLVSAVSTTPGPSNPAQIRVSASNSGVPISPNLFGSNLAAWLTNSHLSNAKFRARAKASGASIFRLPGGSWSNTYGWLSCQMGANQANAQPCGDGWETWGASKPTDFLAFLKATNTQGMWVVNPNGSKKEAAALVAFFNAQVTDTTIIGVDRFGFDWKTSGHWATLRASVMGTNTPYPIKIWSFGNEVYGGTAGAGVLNSAMCSSFGWESVWTCDGSQYVNGVSGSHEGYFEFKTAMLAVDPTITVAPVATFPFEGANSYSEWGRKVVAGVWGSGSSAASAKSGFIDIHGYPYNNLPISVADILSTPQTYWAGIMSSVKQAFASYAPNSALPPVGMTEYNIVCCQDVDTAQYMTRGVNLLFMSDTLGQLVTHGFSFANAWDMANGRAQGSGTDYGMLLLDTGSLYQRTPQYFALRMWSLFGSTLLPSSNSLNAFSQLSVYTGRVDSQTLTVLAINKMSSAVPANLSFAGSSIVSGLAHVAQVSDFMSLTVTYNGVPEGSLSNDLSNAPPNSIPSSSFASGALQHTFPPRSVTVLILSTSSVSTSSSSSTTSSSPSTTTTGKPTTTASTTTPSTTTQSSAGDLIIYANGGIPSSWEDWSWLATVTAPYTKVKHSGSSCIKVKLEGAWAGFSLRSSAPISTVSYSSFQFWIKGTGTHQLYLSLVNDDDAPLGSEYAFKVKKSTGWTLVNVNFETDLGGPVGFTRFKIYDRSGVAQKAFYLDDIRLVGGRSNAIIYQEGKIPFGWTDWSWDTTLTAPYKNDAHTGTSSIRVKLTAAWAGFSLHSSLPITNSFFYSSFQLWMKGTTAQHQLSFWLVDDADGMKGKEFSFTLKKSQGWTLVQISLVGDLGSPNNFSRFKLQDVSGNTPKPFYIDDFVLLAKP